MSPDCEVEVVVGVVENSVLALEAELESVLVGESEKGLEGPSVPVVNCEVEEEATGLVDKKEKAHCCSAVGEEAQWSSPLVFEAVAVGGFGTSNNVVLKEESVLYTPKITP